MVNLKRSWPLQFYGQITILITLNNLFLTSKESFFKNVSTLCLKLNASSTSNVTVKQCYPVSAVIFYGLNVLSSIPGFWAYSASDSPGVKPHEAQNKGLSLFSARIKIRYTSTFLYEFAATFLTTTTTLRFTSPLSESRLIWEGVKDTPSQVTLTIAI